LALQRKRLLLQFGIVSVALSTLCAAVNARAQEQYARTHASAMGTLTAKFPATQKTVVRDLPLDGGGFDRVMFYGAAMPERGVIVMFPGGAGDIGIGRDGTIRNGDNFVVRTRDLWAQKGYSVLLVAAVGHHSMRGERSTPGYAALTQQVIAFAHEESHAPVWVMGTSQGSIGAHGVC
jgi:hypothetical protein